MQALLRTQGNILMLEALPEMTPTPAASGATPPGESRLDRFIREQLARGATNLYETAHQEFDRELLTLVLHATGGNQFQAAKVLGIARQTLRTRLRKLGMHVGKSVEGDSNPPLN